MGPFRIKASRSPYRRAGFALGSAAWVELPEDLSPDRLVVLARDPVVIFQAFSEGDWKIVPMPDRLEGAQQIADYLAFQSNTPSEEPVAAERGVPGAGGQAVEEITARADQVGFDGKAEVESGGTREPREALVVQPVAKPKPAAAKKPKAAASKAS